MDSREVEALALKTFRTKTDEPRVTLPIYCGSIHLHDIVFLFNQKELIWKAELSTWDMVDIVNYFAKQKGAV
jgi:hypothetical protein